MTASRIKLSFDFRLVNQGTTIVRLEWKFKAHNIFRFYGTQPDVILIIPLLPFTLLHISTEKESQIIKTIGKVVELKIYP